MKNALAVFLSAAVAVFSVTATAFEVVYDKRTPQEHREWGERNYLEAHMELAARRICDALYGSDPRARHYENFTISLYLSPVKGGNPAFASGRRITWKVGEHPSGTLFECPGILVHEMAHVLDMKTDRVFNEAMADWVRYYRVCASPDGVIDRRYAALRGNRKYGKYAAGANFVDFLTQNYGEGTVYKVLQGYAKHGEKVWENVFGKSFDGLLAEWRQMETIHDPIFQWTYDGKAAGKRRWDGKLCALRSVAVKEASDKSGAWLDGATVGRVKGDTNGNLTIALHGRFPSGGAPVAIASLGAAKEGAGKSVLLASGQRRDTLYVHVVATVHGKPCAIVATERLSVPDLATKSHSVVLSVAKGSEARVTVDAEVSVVIDMTKKCDGCTFAPAFALGGMSGGIGVAGFSEPRGEGGVLLDDMRVFTRSFRERETKSYAATFNADYRGAVAVTARWCGKPGDSAIDNPKNWSCHNSIGERVEVLPSKETAVVVCGSLLPSIPAESKFVCKSFTIDGLAIVDKADIDLRGVRIVDMTDNTRLITRNGHGIAVNALRGERARLDGRLAVIKGMKMDGDFKMKSGSVLRLPSDPSMAKVKSLSLEGDGEVVLVPGAAPVKRRFSEILRLEENRADLARLRLKSGQDADVAEFKLSQDGKTLGVLVRKP